MDVSVDLATDAKVKKLWRHAPDHAGAAFIAYVATMGESWKEGRRVTIDDSWPAFVPFNKAAIEALVHVGLIDKAGRVSVKAWKGWFEVARDRRTKSRDRWARYNAQRDAVTTSLPRGTNADTASSVPPVLPSVPPSRPPDAPAGVKKNAPEEGTRNGRGGPMVAIGSLLRTER
jgi:hypothetical protein